MQVSLQRHQPGRGGFAAQVLGHRRKGRSLLIAGEDHPPVGDFIRRHRTGVRQAANHKVVPQLAGDHQLLAAAAGGAVADRMEQIKGLAEVARVELLIPGSPAAVLGLLQQPVAGGHFELAPGVAAHLDLDQVLPALVAVHIAAEPAFELRQQLRRQSCQLLQAGLINRLRYRRRLRPVGSKEC